MNVAEYTARWVEALGLLLFLGALGLIAGTCAGCGPGARGTQADVIAGAAVVWTKADAAIVEIRARHLDAIVEEAESECGSGGCSEERAAFYRDALAAEERRWAPLMECRAPVPSALSRWLDVVEVEDASLGDVVGVGARFIGTWGTFTECVNANTPEGEELLIPPLPDGVTTLARTAGGEDGAR